MAEGDNEIGVTPPAEFTWPEVGGIERTPFENNPDVTPPVDPGVGDGLGLPASPTAAHPDWQVDGDLAVTGVAGGGVTSTADLSTAGGSGEPDPEPEVGPDEFDEFEL